MTTSVNKQDESIFEYCIDNNILFKGGSENYVLERVFHATEKYNTDELVKISGDWPLIDFRMVDNFTEIFNKNYPSSRIVSNTGPEISMP